VTLSRQERVSFSASSFFSSFFFTFFSFDACKMNILALYSIGIRNMLYFNKKERVMNPVTRRRMRNRIGRGLTFEKVWATIERNAAEAEKQRKEAEKRHAEWEAKWQAERQKEAEQRQKEAAEREAERQKEAEQRQKEAEQRQKEAEQRQKEAAEREAEQQRKAAEQEIERQKEAEKRKKEDEERDRIAERQMQEIRDAHKETERVIKALGEQMGGLHRSFGEMAEHLVAPGIVDRFNEIGFHIMRTTHGMKILGEKKKVRTEVDLLMENGDYIIAVEVKARFGGKDIDEHRKQLEIVREDANRMGDHRKILGGMAVAILNEDEKKAIIDAGFYLIEQSGDTMKMDLPEDFVPREW
jgi:DNA segregation ATPase FtsK/SpoIIIE-like protein